MARFMIVTFALLGWAFYELSGGADFEPPEVAESPLNTLQQQAAAEQLLVARAAPAPSQASLELADTSGTTTEIGAGSALTQAAADAAVLPDAQTASLAVVLGEAPQPVQPEPVVVEPPKDLRVVNGSRVNVRNGPGTNFSVVAQLTRDAETEVLQDPGNGWVKIRSLESGGVGWMAERLLRPAS